ncbi:MAG: InlB B-repeat-containing protein, partial [Candidatus Bathyarchaeota archaeon]|nr:InlB B-repeat-containing protein [Candidatus Termiticorpusculum sp.]
VTYDGSGGVGVPTDGNVYEQGVTVIVAGPAPTRSGYTFNGWSYGGSTYQVGATFVMPAVDVVLVAQWTQDPVITWSVVFDSDGGSVVASQDVVDGEMAVLPVPDPMKAGYDFVEWQLDGVAFDFDTPITGDVVLKAVWIETSTFTVTYDGSGGVGVPTDGNVYEQGVTVIVAGPAPTRSGYTFNGWSYGGSTYQVGATFVMPAVDVVLVAQWTANPPSTTNSGTATKSTITPKITTTPTPAPSESTPPSEMTPSIVSVPPVDEDFPLWGIMALVIAVIAGIVAAALYFVKKSKT